MNESEPILQPYRVIVGHCPACNSVLVVLNNYETWPPVRCQCGWVGGTQGVANRTHYEQGGVRS